MRTHTCFPPQCLNIRKVSQGDTQGVEVSIVAVCQGMRGVGGYQGTQSLHQLNPNCTKCVHFLLLALGWMSRVVTCGQVLSSMSSASSLLSQGGGCLIMCPQQPQGTLYCMSVPMSSDTLWGTSGRIHRGPGHGQFVCNDAWRGWGLVPHSNSS